MRSDGYPKEQLRESLHRPASDRQADTGLTQRSRRSRAWSALIVLFACFALLLAPARATAATNTYTEGFPGGNGFSIDSTSSDAAWTWGQGADDSLMLTLDGLPGLSTPAITSTQISGMFSLDGQSVENVGFVKFVLHVDIDVEGAFHPLPVVSYTSRRDGTDFHNADVSHEEPGLLEFTPPKTNYGQRPGGAQLTYRVSFQVPSGGASGTITVHDFTLVYEEYVAPPDDDDDGGGGGKDDGDKDDGDKDKPTGVANMGGSGDGSGSGTGGGTGGSGTGSGQGGGNGAGNGAGVRVGEAVGSIGTEAPVTASPRSTADDSVVGYPLRLEDVAGGGEAGGGSGDGAGGEAAGSAASGGATGSGLSWNELLWLAVALAVATPFASAALDRRRVRRRLKVLVEETPDGPASRLTATA